MPLPRLAPCAPSFAQAGAPAAPRPGSGSGAAPALAPIAPPRLPFEKHTLANGLQVVLHEDHSSPLVAVNLWYHVGSKDEKPGKTGFAHLFEHMMFQGSEHHDADFNQALEPLGATDLNGTTDFDRTCYFETVPTNALERTLWLEADRMGWLLPAMTAERFDNQREVVRNERRQRVDNQPYGSVEERLYAVLFPSHHPYSWDVIGHMEDLARAPKEEVEAFFRSYYGPNNCTLVVAGDIDPAWTRATVERLFGPIPPGPPVPRLERWVPEIEREARLTVEDRVPLPRLYVAWHAPARFQPGEAELDLAAGVLAQGKTSRLYKRLVYDLQIAQDVGAFVDARELGGLFQVVVTARPGHTLDEIEPVVMEEVERLRAEPATAQEVERVRTSVLAGFTRGLERIGGFGGKSDRLALYNTYLGDPGHLEEDFARYQSLAAESVQAAARRWLHAGRVVARVVPYPELAAGAAEPGLDRAAEPDLAEPRPLVLPALERARLANGLEVVLARSRKVPVVELQLLVRGGWSADRKDKLGVASFTARMLDEGTPGRSALDISEQAQLLGAELATGSSLDVSWVSLDALKARLEPALALMTEVALEPSFPADEIERQRQQVLARILQEKKRPVSTALRLMPALLYGPDHPYGQPLTGSGSEASVKAIAREDLVAFHRAWFRPGNATLVAAGDVTLGELLPLLERTLGRWPAGDAPAIEVPARPQPERATIYLVDKPGAAQSLLLAGHLVPPRRDPETVPFEVLNGVLGGQFIARLNMNLRERKGYTYGAYSFTFDARGQGAFLAYAEVRTDVTGEALSEILRELEEIRGTRPPTADELQVARDSLTLSLPGQFETASGIAGKVGEIVTFSLPDDHFVAYPARVAAVTERELVELARRWILPDRLAIVVVGDRAAVEEKLRGVLPGEIVHLDADGRPAARAASR